MADLVMTNWCKTFISESEAQAVSEAVRSAELQTSGEIVPMIVRRSSAIGHVAIQLFLLWIIFVLAVYAGAEHWWHNWISSGWYWGAGLLLAPVFVQLYRFDSVQRVMTDNEDEAAQVFARARIEFEDLKIRSTKNRTGILIFLSVMEHRCVVMADEGIAKKLPADAWQKVVAAVVEGIKSGKPGEGLTRAIQECGKLMAEHFPVNADDKNELSNSLVIKD